MSLTRDQLESMIGQTIAHLAECPDRTVTPVRVQPERSFNDGHRDVRWIDVTAQIRCPHVRGTFEAAVTF